MSKLTPKAKLRASSEDSVTVSVAIPEEIVTLITPPGATAGDTIRALVGALAESCGVDLRYYPSLTLSERFSSNVYVETTLLEVCYEAADLPCAPPQGIEELDPYSAPRALASSALYDLEGYSARAGRTNPLGSTLARLHYKQRELASAITAMRKLARYDSVYRESGRPTREDALAELERVCALLPCGAKEALWGWVSVDVLIEVMEDYAKALRADLEARRDLDEARLAREQRARAERVYKEGVVARERAVVNGIAVKRRRRAVPQETSALFPSWAAQEEEAILGAQLARYGTKEAETRYAGQERRIERERIHELEEEARLASEEVAARNASALPIAESGTIPAPYPAPPKRAPKPKPPKPRKLLWAEGTPKRAYYDRKMRERRARAARKRKEES